MNVSISATWENARAILCKKRDELYESLNHDREKTRTELLGFLRSDRNLWNACAQKAALLLVNDVVADYFQKERSDLSKAVDQMIHAGRVQDFAQFCLMNFALQDGRLLKDATAAQVLDAARAFIANGERAVRHGRWLALVHDAMKRAKSGSQSCGETLTEAELKRHWKEVME